MFVEGDDYRFVVGWQGGVRSLPPRRWGLIKLTRLVPTHISLVQSHSGGLVLYVRQDLVTTLSLTYVRVVGDLRPSGVGMLRNSLGLAQFGGS